MNNKRPMIRKIHSFTDKIIAISQDRYYHKDRDEEFYRLKINDSSLTNQIKVYQRKINENVFKSIINEECINKSYLFYYEKIGSTYHLKD